jgi:hypothetical protein
MSDNDDDDLLPPSNDRTFTLMMLGTLTGICTEADAEVGVSLLVSGTWVSGTLTTFRRYIDAFTSQVNQATGQQADAFARAWTSVMETMVGQLLDEPFHDELAVYLRDAWSWLPDGTEVELPAVAIRRDSVDVFHLGQPPPSP